VKKSKRVMKVKWQKREKETHPIKHEDLRSLGSRERNRGPKEKEGESEEGIGIS